MVCFHCGDKCNSDSISLGDKTFCCNGCRTVFQILNENDLCAYYDLNEHAGISVKESLRQDKFAYLENSEIESKLIQFKDEKQTHVTFYLPQIHCSSCLYLLENIHRINKSILVSKINFTKKEVFLVFNHQESTLREVVETLAKIGYEPHISLHSGDIKEDKISKSKIYKIGIAGFCFANIMLLSFPEYFTRNTHLEDNLQIIFTYLCLGLSLPVVFYSASEFYNSAWNGIKNRYLNIDIPVALAVVITFLRSLYVVFFQGENGYFDSMSGIVFFMLIGRIAQEKTHHYLSFERDYKSFFPIAVNKKFAKDFKPVPVEQVTEGDIIQIYSNEIVPVDAILSKGNAEIDYSFVSGESIPVVRNIGDIIYAGGKQLSGRIELMVIKPMEQSYLTNLWNKSNYNPKETVNKFIDTLSKNFTLFVLTLGFSAFTIWSLLGKYGTGLDALTTVLIVACPCTLLLASTFTYGNMMRILAKNKLYIRHHGILEQFNHISAIVFDKTGTLTHGNEIEVVFKGNDISEVLKSRIVSLAAQSKHPYSKAIANYWKDVERVPLDNFKESLGKGLEAWIDDQYIKIGSSDFFNIKNETSQNIVLVAVDNEVFGHFVFSNVYRKGFAKVFYRLKSRAKQYILSGDSSAEKSFLEKTLGEGVSLQFNQKPDDKLSFIQNMQSKGTKVMMIGDGLNDAGALKQSDVGIAVSEGNNNFTPACDAILEAEQLNKLPDFLDYALQGKKVIKMSFAFSFIYNVVGLYFALQGLLSPIIAAILMPMSSVTIIFLTFGASQYYAWKLNLLNNQKVN